MKMWKTADQVLKEIEQQCALQKEEYEVALKELEQTKAVIAKYVNELPFKKDAVKDLEQRIAFKLRGGMVPTELIEEKKKLETEIETIKLYLQQNPTFELERNLLHAKTEYSKVASKIVRALCAQVEQRGLGILEELAELLHEFRELATEIMRNIPLQDGCATPRIKMRDAEAKFPRADIDKVLI